jgi:glycosyltransferase involved in cell wall biosynthesis
MWDSPYRGFPDTLRMRGLRDTIVRMDNAGLAEAHRVFTNSAVVAGRLARFNRIAAEVLYPPILRPELFTAGDYGDEIVGVCRMEHHKRQHLAVAAMALTRSPVRLRLCGLGMDPGYIAGLRASAAAAGVADRVTFETRWITEAEKAARLATALASVYVPLDEDSYGYPTIEAAHAARCTITVTDSGGVTEFVRDGETGLVVAPAPQALADAFDRLYTDRAAASRLGRAARRHIDTCGIAWDPVIEKLLA